MVQDIDSSKKTGERKSFLLSRKLYNSVTGNKDINSKIIVSYTNQYNQYNALKKNLKKTVFLVIGSRAPIEPNRTELWEGSGSVRNLNQIRTRIYFKSEFGSKFEPNFLVGSGSGSGSGSVRSS